MKPCTKLQKKVVALSAKLPQLTQAQIAWIKRNAVPAFAFKWAHESWCVACGNSFPNQNTRRCPYCGARLETFDEKRKATHKSSYYTSIHTTCQGFQVTRLYLAKRLSRKGHAPEWIINEVSQIWISEQGKATAIGRDLLMSAYYSDLWNFNKPMSLKKDCLRYEIDSYSNRYCRILPILKRNGFTGDTHNIPPVTLFRKILSDNKAEFLLKTGQAALLKQYILTDDSRFFYAIKVCNRNGYIVKDASLWRDYIRLLEYFGLDSHNAHYVCPKDLQLAHDTLVAKKRKIEREKRKKEQLEYLQRANEAYLSRMCDVIGIQFSKGLINYHVLRSVHEFEEEGEAMHHCVFANEYYNKSNTIILSACNVQGKRLETVEYNTHTHQVVQSRGARNGVTPQHDEIVEAVNLVFSKLLYEHANKSKASSYG